MTIDASHPSAAYMRRWTGSALVQIMACRLNGVKPLSEPMLTYCQLDLKEHISMKSYFKLNYFHSMRCVWTCCLRNVGHLVQGRWVKYPISTVLWICLELEFSNSPCIGTLFPDLVVFRYNQYYLESWRLFQQQLRYFRSKSSSFLINKWNTNLSLYG